MGYLTAIILISIIIFVISKQTKSSKKDLLVAIPEIPIEKSEKIFDIRNFWVTKDQPCQINEYQIPGGMIYIRDKFRKAPYNNILQQSEPAFINYSLPVNASNPDYHGETLSYYPSYSSITPRARASYLNWLATGKSDPHTHIGYVFLYFYGLERRILVDLNDDDPNKETDLIKSEITRLLHIYSKNNSFQRYAEGLLAFIHAKQGQLASALSISERYCYRSDQLPLSLRIKLAEYSIAGKPIPSDLALDWVRYHPQTYLRTPATRCYEQLKTLFKIRYLNEFGEGMVIKPNKSMLKIEYAPASIALSHIKFSIQTSYPDVDQLSLPLSKLTLIVRLCVDELDSYSRYLGRYPDNQNSMQACALLPKVLLSSLDLSSLNETREYLNGKFMNNTYSFIQLNDLLKIWNLPTTEKLSKSDSVHLAQLLEGIHYGMEPDARFTGSGIDPSVSVVLFRQTSIPPSVANNEYTEALLRLQITALVCLADNVISESEQLFLDDMISNSSALTDAEKVRLRAHLLWYVQSGPTLSGVKKKLIELSNDQKIAIASFIVTTAKSDGNIDPNEVSLLSKMYSMLGLQEEQLHSTIHQLMTSNPAKDDEPVVIQPAGKQDLNYTISNPAPQPTKVSLDQAAIRRKMTETAAVSSLLQDIFTEEVTPDPIPQTSPSLHGLSPALSTLLKKLVEKEEWARGEIEQLAHDLGLMPNGAIESLNEIAFELVDEPILEGEDPIIINLQLYEEMQNESKY